MNLKFEEIRKEKLSDFVKEIPYLIDENFLQGYEKSNIVSFKDKKPLGFYVFRKFENQKRAIFENLITTEESSKDIFADVLDDFLKRNQDCNYIETNFINPDFKNILIKKGFEEAMYAMSINMPKKVSVSKCLNFKKISIVETRELFYEKALETLLNESFHEENKRNYVLILKNNKEHGIYQYVKNDDEIFFVGVVTFEKNPTKSEIVCSIIDCLNRENFKKFSLITKFKKVKERLEKIGFKVDGIKFLYSNFIIKSR